jgi:hypothetical protein
VPRWLFGGILGVLTSGLDLVSALKKELPIHQLIILVAARVLIGIAIGFPAYYRVSRHFRWIRGIAISVALSTPIAIIIPNLWQSILGFGIAYGAIIGYLVDRILPLPVQINDK